MKHLRKFNEVNGNRMPRVKEFLVKDLSGRGFTSTLEKEDIEDIKGEMVVILEGKLEEEYIPLKSISEEINEFNSESFAVS